MRVQTWRAIARESFAMAEQGQTLVEYALIIVLIALGTLTAMTFMRDQLTSFFSTVGNSL